MKPLARRILPMVLIIIGLWLLSGCIYVPMFNRPIKGQNAAKLVGERDSGKTIRVGASTRKEIVQHLGEPMRTSQDGLTLMYQWTTQSGAAIYPLCFGVLGIDRYNALILTLDDRDILQSFRVEQNKDFFDGVFHHKSRHRTPKEFLEPSRATAPGPSVSD